MVRILEKRGIVDGEYRTFASHLCHSDLRCLVGTRTRQMGQVAQSSEEPASSCIACAHSRRLRFVNCSVLFGVYPIGTRARTYTVATEHLTNCNPAVTTPICLSCRINSSDMMFFILFELILLRFYLRMKNQSRFTNHSNNRHYHIRNRISTHYIKKQ